MNFSVPSREDVQRLLETSRTIREAAIRSGMRSGMTWRTFERIARDYGVYRQIRRRAGFNKIPLSEILEGKHLSYATCHLLKRLVAEGYKAYQCEECGIADWRGRPLSLQLDHVDGDSSNHRRENIRLLCPNCHTQTPTYGSKNCCRNVQMHCPSCGSAIKQFSPPVGGPSNDTSEAWICLWCDATVCERPVASGVCYAVHAAQAHGEQPTGGHMKNQKHMNVVAYIAHKQ